MVKTGYVVVELNEIFDFGVSTNSGLTKTFVNLHKGDVPVYGASQNDEIPSYGYIEDKLDGIKYFDDCLTYNKDGASGMVFFRKGHFTISEKVVPLVLFEKYKDSLDFVYLKYAIENETKKQNYTFSNKATKITFKNLHISIPVNDNGDFDMSKQKILAERYIAIEEQKQLLLKKAQELEKISVMISEESMTTWSYPLVVDLFYPQGGNAEYTKEWVSKNEGVIPLYSGTTVGEYAYINRADYSGEYLTWCIDGFAGYIMYHNEKFSITCHRGILIPTDKCIDIDLKYIKYVLEPIFRKRKKGREGELGKNEYTSLKPIAIKRMKDAIPIPIREDGTYDVEKQKELADKYEQIEQIKKNLIQKITELTNIVVA